MSPFRRRKQDQHPMSDMSAIEAHLSREFGLAFRPEGVEVSGAVSDKFAPALRNAERCLAMLAKIRQSHSFGQVCVVGGTPAVVICNTTPPLAFVTSLGEVGVGELVAAIANRTGQRDLIRHRGAWLLTF